MNKIRKGDEVIVIAGRDKGKRGKISLRKDDSHVVVDGGIDIGALLLQPLHLVAAALDRDPALLGPAIAQIVEIDHLLDLAERESDALAAQVGGGADAGIGADIDAGMPEQPRHEGGDADIGRVARCDRADIARERKLRDVEFLVAEGAKENLLG